MYYTGLGHTATHPPGPSVLIPESWFRGSIGVKPNPTPSALNILARILADPGIPGFSGEDGGDMYETSVKRSGGKLLDHIESWSPDFSTKEGSQKALEEVAYAVTLMYGAAGLTQKEDGLFNADFFK